MAELAGSAFYGSFFHTPVYGSFEFLENALIEVDERGTIARVLREGETVVLFSDGVADDLKEGQRAWLQAQLPALRALAPQAAAEHLLSQARARDGGKALDDMTVLICRAVPGSNC